MVRRLITRVIDWIAVCTAPPPDSGADADKNLVAAKHYAIRDCVNFAVAIGGKSVPMAWLVHPTWVDDR